MNSNLKKTIICFIICLIPLVIYCVFVFVNLVLEINFHDFYNSSFSGFTIDDIVFLSGIFITFVSAIIIGLVYRKIYPKDKYRHIIHMVIGAFWSIGILALCLISCDLYEYIFPYAEDCYIEAFFMFSLVIAFPICVYSFCKSVYNFLKLLNDLYKHIKLF